MKSLKLIIISLLVMALVLPTAVFAKDTDKAGKVTAVEGKAEVKKSGGSKKFNAFKGMAITQGDTIMTGSDGKITMDLDSDKEVTIGTNTTLVVSELVKSAKALSGKTSLSLLKGKVVISIKKKLDGDSRFEIETPTAIMGVMGTQFTVRYEDEQSYVGVFEGAVKTKHGDKRAAETLVNPNEQLRLDQKGEGKKEKLNYLDLPLIALEHYLQLLEKDAKSDKTLIGQVKQQIEKLKKEEAAAAANENVGSTTDSTIVYEDKTGQTGGGGSIITPTATPTPTPTVTPTVAPTATPPVMPTDEPVATPTIAPTEGPVATPTIVPSPMPTELPLAPPVLDASEFYSNLYTYMRNDKVFILPFTTNIALNNINDITPADASQVIKFEIFQPETEGYIDRTEMVDKISIDSSFSDRMSIELREAVAYGSDIRITVYANQLKNADTGAVQDLDQVTVNEEGNEGFEFKFKEDYTQFDYIHGDPDSQVNWMAAFSSLGYQYDMQYAEVTRICSADDECPPEYVYNLNDIMSVSTSVSPSYQTILSVTLFGSYFASEDLDVGLYKISIHPVDRNDNPVEGTIDIYANVRRAAPPEPLSESAYMSDASTLVLPFTTPLVKLRSVLGDGLAVKVCDFGESPPLVEGGENEGDQPCTNVSVDSVTVDPESADQLIVVLSNPMEYGANIKVVVEPWAWLNPETMDVQKEEHNFYLRSAATLQPYYVQFLYDGLEQTDEKVTIHTLGYDIGEIRMYCYGFAGSCEGFEPPYRLEDEVYRLTGDGATRELTLLGSYFNQPYVRPGWYELYIPIMQNGEQIDGIYLIVWVSPPPL
ncbi:FecR domain-containing protein [Paenibacillus paridis]|uniref:FecR domain-containing protein n=1 Tax=Paenibacillus paridis TaxID=2583376 RepID=UPI00111DEFD7|nr:FecR domain-containing protein [Paenibacillus paridis]